MPTQRPSRANRAQTEVAIMKSSVVVETSLDAVHGSNRVDAWQQMCGEALIADRVWPAKRTPDELSGTIRRRWIDDILFVEFECTGFGAMYRTDSVANEYFGFGVSPDTYGERLVLRDSRVFDLWSTAYAWANAEVREYVQLSPGRQLIVYVPRTAMRAAGGRVADRVDLIAQPKTPSVRLLTGMLETLRRETGRLDSKEAVAIRNSLVELMARVLRDEAPDTNAAVSGVMRANIERWIGRNVHLGSASVSAESAAQVHGISLRSLYRLFEATDDSFSSVVRSARISRARSDVIEARDSFQTIAMRWGFADASHFSREFRRHFGVTPREVRAGVRDED